MRVPFHFDEFIERTLVLDLQREANVPLGPWSFNALTVFSGVSSLMVQEKEHISSTNGGGVNGVGLFHDEYSF